MFLLPHSFGAVFTAILRPADGPQACSFDTFHTTQMLKSLINCSRALRKYRPLKIYGIQSTKTSTMIRRAAAMTTKLKILKRAPWPYSTDMLRSNSASIPLSAWEKSPSLLVRPWEKDDSTSQLCKCSP